MPGLTPGLKLKLRGDNMPRIRLSQIIGSMGDGLNVQINELNARMAAQGTQISIHETEIEELKLGIGTGGGDDTPVVVTQVNKINITGSLASPYIIEIPITKTTDYARPPAGVLKFTPGTEGLVVTECSFNNGDASSFTADPSVIFDGLMHLGNSDTITLVNQGALGSSTLYTADIDLAAYRAIDKLEVS